MALLPTVPTSFAPRPAASLRRQLSSDFTGVFDFLAYAILFVMFALALGIFFYGRILATTKSTKDAELAKAESSIDTTTVENFVRLRDRLTSSQMLLNNHTALSNFFSALTPLLPTTVRFNSLHLTVDATGVSRVEGAGTARSFNALAAASSAFATDGRIKDVIFSNISVNKDSSVSFSISAMLDPKITTFSP